MKMMNFKNAWKQPKILSTIGLVTNILKFANFMAVYLTTSGKEAKQKKVLEYWKKYWKYQVKQKGRIRRKLD